MKIHIEDLACDVAEKIQNKTVKYINEDMNECSVTLHVDNISDGGDVVTLLCKDGQLIDLYKDVDFAFITVFK